MAFIRSYSRAARLSEVGDPFSLRVPKRLRKLQLGKTVGRIAQIGASFIPGLGGVVSSAIGSRLNQVSQRYGIDPDILSAFARQYGIDVGDAVGTPVGKPATKRRAAASGTKAKAAAKADKRAATGTTKTMKSTKKSKGPGAGAIIAKNAAAAGKGVVDIGGAALKGDYAGALKELLGGKIPSAVGAGGAAAPRKRTRVINLSALNRALSRINRFEKTVARVNKSRPMRRFARHASAPARGRGHRAGCGCAVCRRAA